MATKKESINRDKAFYRLDATTRIRKESVDFAVKIMRILPHSCKKPVKVLDLAHLIHGFIQDNLLEDINKLPTDMIEGIRKKYTPENDPFEDLL